MQSKVPYDIFIVSKLNDEYEKEIQLINILDFQSVMS